MTTEDTAPTRFVFRATDSSGRREIVEITAATPDAARYRLEIQGYTDPELVEDALSHRVSRAIGSEDVWDGMTTAERIEFQQKAVGPGRHGFVLWQTLKGNWWIILLLGAGVWWRAGGPNPWGFWSIVIYLAAFVWLKWTVNGWRRSVLYDQLQVAKNWERWDEAESLLPKLRRLGWIPEFDFAFTEAKILAGRGDLPTAVERVRPFSDPSEMDPSLYLGLLSGVYETGRDYPESIRCLEEQLALDPDSANELIDLAFAVAFRLADFDRASEALSRVDPADITPIARGHVGLTRALIAIDKRDWTTAEIELVEAEAYSVQTAGEPMTNGMAMLMRAYRAITQRSLGREADAAALFATTEPWLKSTREHQVLEHWPRAATDRASCLS